VVGLHLEQMAGMTGKFRHKNFKKKEHGLDSSGSAGHTYKWRDLVTMVMSILDARKASNLRTSEVKNSPKQYTKQNGNKATKGRQRCFFLKNNENL
jgi:hypothetical protein